MTPVRSKRGALIHVTHNLRKTMCGKKCDAWIVEPDAAITCIACHIASTTN